MDREVEDEWTVKLKVNGTLQSSTAGVRLGDSLPPILSAHMQYSSLQYT